MFLNQLTSAEKEAFVSLSIHAARANGIVENTEYELLEAYCKEMGIAFFDANNLIDLERIVAVFKDAEITHKKIALFEILGLLHADGRYDEQERAFVIDYAKRIALTEEDVNKQSELVDKYIALIAEMNDALN